MSTILQDKNKQWRDITELLNTCASEELKMGDMIHSSQSFQLYDVMSAIEIMDPKMDMSMTNIDGVESKRIPNVEERILDSSSHLHALTQANISPSLLLSIMDLLYCAEVSWYSGHSLPQTVYSCLLFHLLDWPQDVQLKPLFQTHGVKIQNPILSLYLKSVLKSVELVFLFMKECDNKDVLFSSFFFCNIYFIDRMKNF